MSVTPIHQLRPPEVFRALATSAEGISPAEALARQGLYGKNLLEVKPAQAAWKRFAGHALHPFGVVLWISGGVAFAARDAVLGIVIWSLVLVNAAFSFWREHRAEEAILALRRLLPGYTRVIRGGIEVSLPAEEVVPGDVLVLAEGDNIPADARVVAEYGLRVSNVTLTGEAVPARKTADASFREDISELDRPNLVFAGTAVVSGTGRAVAFATGMLTQFGRVAYLTQAAPDEPGLLQQEILQVTRKIALVAGGVSLIVFFVGLVDVGLGLLEAFLLSLGVLVAAIPEGLPATVTLSLAAAGQRLAQQGVLVKRLAALETLGAVSVICTDKSGTLTQNQMTVTEIWTGGQMFTLSGAGYDPSGAITPLPAETDHLHDLELLLTAGSLCNNARLSPPREGKPAWSSLGDGTEAALRVAARKAGLDEDALSARYPRVHELPFDARRKRMSTIHRRASVRPANMPEREGPSGFPADEGMQGIAVVKGAPREVLDLCTHIRMHDGVQGLDENLRSQVMAANDCFAAQARRVLALAYRGLPLRSGSYSGPSVEHNLTFLGLAALHDPPRPEVAQAVGTCKAAGIRIVMITGDYGLTAAALARRVGLIENPAARVITGAEIELLSDADLAPLLEQEIVYARMAPEHKLRLVAALQARGETVAVIGDGVNDAPALRKADIGVAMGITGTDVAKEAADIILTDDNFARLVSAIEAGRAVYENVRKFITYIFSSNVPEILPFLLTSLTNIPLALTVRQILAIDLGTDLLPGLALGVENPEPGLMNRPPRRRSEKIITRSVLRRAFLWLGPLETVLAYSGFFLVYALLAGGGDRLEPVLANLGWDPTHTDVHMLAVTVFHAGVVLAQIGNAFACRTATQRGRALGWFSNRWIWLGTGASFLMILALVYVPPLARAFNHVPLPAATWAWLALYAPALYGLDWLRKL